MLRSRLAAALFILAVSTQAQAASVEINVDGRGLTISGWISDLNPSCSPGSPICGGLRTSFDDASHNPLITPMQPLVPEYSDSLQGSTPTGSTGAKAEAMATQTSLLTSGLFEASGKAAIVLTPGTWGPGMESAQAESSVYVGFTVNEPVHYSLGGVLSGVGGYVQMQFLDTDLNLQISEAIPIDLSGRLEPGEYTFLVVAKTISYSGNTAINNQAAYDLSMTLTPVPLPAAPYLFGSGMLGLLGIARRRKTA
jgi:hypothetical protein